MSEMLHKNPICDESIMPYPNMEAYLTNPQSNLNNMQLHKSANQIANVPQPNCNMVVVNKQPDNLQHKQFPMRQLVPNQTCVNNGMMTNSQVNCNTPTPNSEMSRLYHIGEYCNPIDKLSLAVKNGQLYGPFSLPYNQLQTEVEFQLTEESLNQIKQRSDLDIVLISRLVKENEVNLIRWPPVSISINDTALVFEIAMFNKVSIHLPQFIKAFCVTGKNVVKFELSEMTPFNSAAFEFNIYMVHRPTIVHAKKLSIDSAFVSEELTYKLLRENCLYLSRDYVNVSTLCPFTLKKIEIPARLKCCTHLQPFDLVPFLKMQARWMLSMCPCCTKSLIFNFNELQQNIVIDKVLHEIFEKTPLGCDMVSITINGTFQSIPNSIVSGVEIYQRNQNSNNVMIHGRQGIPLQVNEINGRMMVHPSQSMPINNYRLPDQPMNFQLFNANQYRMMNNTHGNTSMIDLHHLEEQSMQPHINDKNLLQKPVKRKSSNNTQKNKVEAIPNVIENVNHLSNGALTPPSTRTSSVASTSSPDSLNVPHSNLKRPSSIDLLPNTVLSDCHLSAIGDDMGLYSSPSVSQINNSSFNTQTKINQQQQNQYYNQLYQLPSESKPLLNYPGPDPAIVQQFPDQQFQQQNQLQPPIGIQQYQSQHHLQNQPQHLYRQQQKIQYHHESIQAQHQSLIQQRHQVPYNHLVQTVKDPLQFRHGLPTSSTTQSMVYHDQSDIINNSHGGSMKEDSPNYTGSVKNEPLNYHPGSVKNEPLNYHPGSVKNESLSYIGSTEQKQESLIYSDCVNNKLEPFQLTSSFKQEPSTTESHSTQQQYHHHYNSSYSDSSSVVYSQQLSNSSCSSSLSNFIDHILSTHEPVPEADKCPWLEGFSLINLQESVNLSDVEEF